MFCENCGKELIEGSKFCPNCGAEDGEVKPKAVNVKDLNTPKNKRMFKITAICLGSVISILVLLVIISLFINSSKSHISRQQTRYHIIDNAGLLTSSEKDSLMNRLDSIAKTYSIDLVIVTENGIGSIAPKNYADNFFYFNGYGLGNDRDGCIFLIVSETRQYWFSTSGRAIGILNPDAFEKLESDAVRFLKEDNYYAAFISFLENWEYFMIRN